MAAGLRRRPPAARMAVQLLLPPTAQQQLPLLGLLILMPHILLATKGLGGSPSLGFNNCNIQCCNSTMPNAEFVKNTADLFVKLGLKAAGFQYVNMDVSLAGIACGRFVYPCAGTCLRVIASSFAALECACALLPPPPPPLQDCWDLKEREKNGTGPQIPVASKFPDGIKNVTDYVHSLGLKFGL